MFQPSPLDTAHDRALLAAVLCHQFTVQLTWLTKLRRNCHCSFQLLAPAPPETAAWQHLFMAYFYSAFPLLREGDMKNWGFSNFLLLPEFVVSVSKGKQFLLARQTLPKCVSNTLSPKHNTHESVKQTGSASHSHLYCKIKKKRQFTPKEQPCFLPQDFN